MRLRPPPPSPLRVFSVCSGISAASVAWKPLGMEVVGFAEIGAFACHVLAQRCGATAPKYLPKGWKRSAYRRIRGGTVLNFGDLLQMTDDDLRALGIIHVLEGGTPCQGFSIAGLRGGLMDPRWKPTLAFLQLIHRMRRINGLKYVIWENVNGVFSTKGNTFGHVLAGMAAVGGRAFGPLVPPESGWTGSGHVLSQVGAFAWRTLDAQYWGVAARRKRVFLLGVLGASRVCPLEVLGDRGPCAGSAGPRRDTEGEDWQFRDSADARGGAARGDQGGRAIAYIGGQGAEAATIGASDTVAPTIKSAQSGSCMAPFVAQEVSHREWHRYLVRKMTPLECERLMGFPDGWTDVMYRGGPAADSPRYGVIGNSIAVPCLTYIGEKLLQEHMKAMTAEEERYEDAA